jgi:hypothetical protein
VYLQEKFPIPRRLKGVTALITVAEALMPLSVMNRRNTFYQKDPDGNISYMTIELEDGGNGEEKKGEGKHHESSMKCNHFESS